MATETRAWPNVAIPPGETLSEMLEAVGMSQAELARRAGRPIQAINEIVAGTKEITADTALQLERVLGAPAHFWVRLEADYRVLKARIDDRKRLMEEVPLAALYPYAQMAQHGWVKPTRDKVERVTELLQFFAVASLRGLVKKVCAVFRKSSKIEASREALIAWLRQGERQALEVQASPFNERGLLEALPALRSLTREAPEEFEPRLKTILAENGVALVLVPHLSGTGAQGATRWHGSAKAIVQMSLRYKWADVFWFSLHHELGHILLHGRREFFIEGVETADTDREKEADDFATEQLIPGAEYSAFLSGRTTYSHNDVVTFAGKIGVAPSIVVGRLHHDGLIPHSWLNDLRVRFEWASKDERSERS